METEVLIQMPMYFEVQGGDALDLIAYSLEEARYQVKGFSDPSLLISDFRREVNQVLGKMLSVDDVSRFASYLCQPAETVLERTAEGNLHMKLYETTVQVPELMCWIVVGIESELPQYPNLIEEIQPIEMNRSAGLCIYPLEHEQMAAFIGLSANVSSHSSKQPE